MKKTIFTLLILTLFTLTFVTCEKNEVPFLPESTSQINIDQVKHIYENSFKKEAFTSLRRPPLWEEAENYTLNGKAVIEVPFYNLKAYDLAESTAFSYDKLVASVDSDNNLSVNIVHFYSRDVEKALSTTISYSEPNNFNGFITVFDFDKTPLEVNRYLNGVKSEKQYEFKSRKYNEGETILKRVNEDCEIVEEMIYTRTCWYWIYDDNSTEVISCSDWVPDFNTYQDCSGDGGHDNTETGGVTHRTEEEEIQILDSLTGKAKCIYDKLNNSSTKFADAIKKFDGDFPVSHLSLKIDNTLAEGNYGRTHPPENFNIVIEFSNTQLSNISDVGSAVAFAHEVIHAEIFRKMLSAAKKGDLNQSEYTTEERVNYVNSLRNNFPGLYDYYWDRFRSTWNHNLMAQHYRTTIADIAQQFDDNKFSRQVYEDIAWAGLRILEDMNNSVAWDNLSTSEKQRVLDNLKNIFQNGTSDCN
ncbi:hypothetical protein [Aureibaculum conchae]|uniref:hypothetical protein n=1 Tax=Aureibaculum sp. 2308TA14-22 TaxID=3108392 RepID=UPI00339AF3DC